MILVACLLTAFAGPWTVRGYGPAPSDWGDFEDYEFDDDATDDGDSTADGLSPGDETSASQTVTQAQSPAPKGDNGIGGALRLVGAFSHQDDSARDLGLQDDAIVASVGRLLVDHRGKLIKIELNAFIELGRTASAGGLTGAFGTAATNTSAYRHEYLTVPFWSEGSMSGVVGLDRARVALEKGAWLIEAGRFPISHSVTTFWTPNDFFAPFAANAVNRIYKPGIEAVRVSFAPDPLSTVELLVAPGFEDGYSPAWSHSALVARASTVQWGWDFSAVGGKLAQRWIAGGGLQGTIGQVGVRAEGHLGVPDLDGLGHKGNDRERGLHGRVAGGPNYNFEWKSSTISLEYAYFSDGVDSVSDGAALTQRISERYPDDLPYLGRHYVAGFMSTQFIGVLSGALLGMVNAQDGSGLAGLTLNYSVANEADLVAGAFIPWGSGLRTPTPENPVPTLGSEFGTAPLSIYLESRVFF